MKAASASATVRPVRSSRHSIKRRAAISNVLKVLIGIGICLAVLAPLLLTIFASLKSRGAIARTSPLLPPLEDITFDNYRTVFSNDKLYIGFQNTFLIVLVSVLCNVLLGTVTAYCVERFQFMFKKLVIGLFFLGMMVPTFVTEIARFGLISDLGLYNTLGAPIVIYVATDLMQLYIYRQHIGKVPVSLDESAMLEGCGHFGVFWRIIFPLLRPATATVVIIKVVNIINDMYIPYLYMPNNKLKTLTTFLMMYSASQRGAWQYLSAAVIIVLIPTTVIYVFTQKYIISGLAAGAVKE